MLRRVSPCRFKHIKEAHQITLHVGGRMIDAMADIGLGTEVDDIVRPELTPQPQYPGGIREIQL